MVSTRSITLMRNSPEASQRSAFLGILLQSALRAVLVVFVAVTLLVEPPNADRGICVAALAVYVVVVACWCAWALRPTSRAAVDTRRYVAC